MNIMRAKIRNNPSLQMCLDAQLGTHLRYLGCPGWHSYDQAPLLVRQCRAAC